MIKKILIPLDGSEFADKSLPYAIELGQKLEAELILVWVLHPMVIMSDYGLTAYQKITSMEENEAKSYLMAAQTELRKHNLSVDTKILEGPVADSIIDLVIQEQIDLVVMSTHGRSGLSRWVYGSVATKVLQHAPCPVFLVRVK
jgi:nucleotide-binding universal stress UspA family protein